MCISRSTVEFPVLKVFVFAVILQLQDAAETVFPPFFIHLAPLRGADWRRPGKRLWVRIPLEKPSGAARLINNIDDSSLPQSTGKFRLASRDDSAG